MTTWIRRVVKILHRLIINVFSFIKPCITLYFLFVFAAASQQHLTVFRKCLAVTDLVNINVNESYLIQFDGLRGCSYKAGTPIMSRSSHSSFFFLLERDYPSTKVISSISLLFDRQNQTAFNTRFLKLFRS